MRPRRAAPLGVKGVRGTHREQLQQDSTTKDGEVYGALGWGAGLNFTWIARASAEAGGRMVHAERIGHAPLVLREGEGKLRRQGRAQAVQSRVR